MRTTNRRLVVEVVEFPTEPGWWSVRIGFVYKAEGTKRTACLGVPVADRDEAERIAGYLRTTLRPHHVAAELTRRARSVA